jgi:D-alanyl-D-alanine carboxypeptidase/D-alanyl-D-alanine-endopeptidase (penicillin-binding protein 4)
MRSSRAALRRAALLPLAALLGACATLARGAPGASSRATPLAAALDSILADTSLAQAHWGVLVKSLRTGEVLYEENAEKEFVPASNMKLVTTSVALEALGPEYRWRTGFSAGGRVAGGVLQGPLVVRGSGDPTLSARFNPDPRAPFRAWADSLRAHGITRIAGGIVGVDSAFTPPTLGAGWAWDDLDAYYASEFGALEFNEGAIDVQVIPSRNVGRPAVVVLDPPTQYVPVDNRTTTATAGSATHLEITRDPVGPGIRIAGVVAADTPYVVQSVAVRDPTDYFLAVLRETLREAGVAVEGQALAAEDWPTARPAESPIFTYSSPTLGEVLPKLLKPSQNWIAETFLRTLGRERRGEGSAAAAGAVVDSTFRSWGLPAEELRLADGSGLSRYDLVTPRLLVGILTHMRSSPHWQLWYASLPVGGEDGTLRTRMADPPLRGNVHAKTGTLTGVRSLSGYLTTASGEPLVFSFLVNDHLRSAAAVDRVVDAAVRRLAAGR